MHKMKDNTLTILETLLMAYHEIDKGSPENIVMLHDLHQAFREADLTEKERELITLRYFKEPVPPARNKKDKNGGTNGRPSGGLTDEAVANMLFDGTFWSNKGKYKRMKKSALTKFQTALGEGYTQDTYAS